MVISEKDDDFFSLHALRYLGELVMWNIVFQELPNYAESQSNADKGGHANRHPGSESHECSIPENARAVERPRVA